MKPIIGISGNEIQDAGSILHNMPITYLPAGYARGIQAAGGLPILIPVGTNEDAKMYISMIDKLILTGGQNVSPSLYGEKSIHEEELTYLERDIFEIALIKETLAQNKPILAVCRGMQLLNVALGGTLIQDLSLRDPEPIKHMQAPLDRWVATHDVIIDKNHVLSQIYGTRPKVNSFHFQSINKLGHCMKVVGKSPDGVIEAVSPLDESKKWLGIQWHPDFAWEELPQEKEMFKYFIERM
ncbi:gamma-glutamyl-gamma-aminobutyrate hydrolase family protein [Vagococcus jeotgali]|uniref:gamma-glutamyl-gamma-aminobutyrate hydrolase family protein n=1 Tax=Vagococcus jeotgali TaxID=3109030 RepID=UPI002DD8723B|nr:gamma-glutamyl-gamma-aminobutyrate hydrolase family protein [Vagococcus sp. B2T-5]